MNQVKLLTPHEVIVAKDDEIKRLRAAMERIVSMDRTGYGRTALARVARMALNNEQTTVSGPPDDYTDQLKDAAFGLFGNGQSV